jgi:hypothetical protein
MAETGCDEQVLAEAESLNGELTCSPLLGLLTVTLASAGSVKVINSDAERERERGRVFIGFLVTGAELVADSRSLLLNYREDVASWCFGFRQPDDQARKCCIGEVQGKAVYQVQSICYATLKLRSVVFQALGTVLWSCTFGFRKSAVLLL